MAAIVEAATVIMTVGIEIVVGTGEMKTTRGEVVADMIPGDDTTGLHLVTLVQEIIGNTCDLLFMKLFRFDWLKVVFKYKYEKLLKMMD